MSSFILEILTKTKSFAYDWGKTFYEKIPDNFLGEENTKEIEHFIHEQTKDLNNEEEAKKFWNRTTHI